jgi:hypothetical protein
MPETDPMLVNAERTGADEATRPTSSITARGPIVDQKALTKVLQDAPHRRRRLDVFDPETAPPTIPS